MSGRQIVPTWDFTDTARLWLVEEYLQEIAGADAGLASLDVVQTWFRHDGARVSVAPVSVAADCTDGFLSAYWRRPHCRARTVRTPTTATMSRSTSGFRPRLLK
ncbi:hypothetical protein GCM10022224_097840 [Nonomuraea antimicrobica]|uniref:Uncharacterized protein n=1 Tax=Nonomuraea antimicrobica TaxID=561173 RepID=A0ABP7EAY3_9ACTN